ncbi:hypothetical protein OAA18_00385 [bacterium]|nr:hypothetical protein [bacterium]
MAAYKQFLSSDVIVTPFEVNKGFIFNQDEFTDPDVQIDKFKGVNADFTTNKNTTGLNSTQYQVLVYNSIKQLYYSNFLSSSTGDSLITASLLPGETPEGDVLRGPSSSTGRYYNYLQSTLVPNRPFFTASNAEVAILSIPSRLFGDYIQPNSFNMEFSGSAIQLEDDGEGNILNGGQVVGNIIYQHGIVTLTSTDADDSQYGTAVYGSAIYGGTTNIVDDFMLATDVTCSFSSSYEIFETQYKATINEFEFNFSQNPSIISGSTDGTVYDFTTGSFFQPYVTTVGLYNEAQELLAVGKLSQPYPLSRTTDTTIFINIDR